MSSHKNHSIIENTRGEVEAVKNPRERLIIIKGLLESLGYERKRTIREILASDHPELDAVLDDDSDASPPEFED